MLQKHLEGHRKAAEGFQNTHGLVEKTAHPRRAFHVSSHDISNVVFQGQRSEEWEDWRSLFETRVQPTLKKEWKEWKDWRSSSETWNQ